MMTEGKNQAAWFIRSDLEFTIINGNICGGDALCGEEVTKRGRQGRTDLSRWSSSYRSGGFG